LGQLGRLGRFLGCKTSVLEIRASGILTCSERVDLELRSSLDGLCDRQGQRIGVVIVTAPRVIHADSPARTGPPFQGLQFAHELGMIQQVDMSLRKEGLEFDIGLGFVLRGLVPDAPGPGTPAGPTGPRTGRQ
jgi:hypothetical protein